MKVLLDVCTPVQVRQALPVHDVHTAVKMGWGELENGDRLRDLLSRLCGAPHKRLRIEHALTDWAKELIFPGAVND